MEKNNTSEVIEGVRGLINHIAKNHYGINAVQSLNIEVFGAGQPGFIKLQTEFNKIDFSTINETIDLSKKIKLQTKELKALEKKHTDLIAIIGESNGENDGSLAHTLLKTIKSELDDLIERKNKLIKEISDNETEFESKIEDQKEQERIWQEEFEIKKTLSKTNYATEVSKLEAQLVGKNNKFKEDVETAQKAAASEIETAENDANRKVKLIKQFSDFLAETNSNMWLYSIVTVVLVIGIMATIYVSIPDLLKCLNNYDTYITNLGPKGTPWQILNLAFGILIIKLPWALCLSAVFTGFYSLLKGLLSTYEKINQDKRNMSAIYAVSGNIAESLNEYGFAIAEHDNEDDETGETFTAIKVTNKQLSQKRESLKWNQIMNYFERMQHHKEEVVHQEDQSKLKLVNGLLNKLIDKLPKQ